MARWLRMLLVAGCPVWQSRVVASHHLLRFVRDARAVGVTILGDRDRRRRHHRYDGVYMVGQL